MESLKEKAYNFDKQLVIALDGPAASGKGTIGRMIAKKLALRYVQSSVVYRSLAYLCIKHNVDLMDDKQIIELSKSEEVLEYANEEDFTDENIGAVASKIAIIPEVRNNLGKILKSWLNESKRIIMEGRDIATVIAPNADLKIFLTADVRIRAQRRYKQLQLEGKQCILPDILAQLNIRDSRDQERDFAPLAPTKSSLVIDTSEITAEEAVAKVMNYLDS